MKIADLLEQKYTKSTPEEREARKQATDYWRKELRKEFAALNKPFDMSNTKPVRFMPSWLDGPADFGGEYAFAAAPDNPVRPELRAKTWQKEMAKKLLELAKRGHGVRIGTRMTKDLNPNTPLEEVLQQVQRETKLMNLKTATWPIFIRFYFTIMKDYVDENL